MRIVVTGASGQLGSFILNRLAASRHEVDAWSGRSAGACAGFTFRPVELTDEAAVLGALRDKDPDVVIHAAAISSAEAVLRDPHRAHLVNVATTRLLSTWASEHGRRLVFTSTDLVFDGESSWYREGDPARPILAYGRTKRAAERFVLDAPGGLVARLSLLYGPSLSGRKGFFDRAVAALRSGAEQAFFTDEFRTPLDFNTAASLLVRLAESDISGVIHVGGPERLSRFELMRRAAVALEIDANRILPSRRAEVTLSEPRPADVSLDTSRLRSVFADFACPRVEEALRRFS